MKLTALLLLTLFLPVTVLAEGPGAGDHAPDFALPGSDGKSHSLASFAGKQGVVLAWFPKAFTGG